MTFYLLSTEIPERELVSNLQGIAAEWKSLGTQLKIPWGKLKEIEDQKSVAVRFSEVLQMWLNGTDVKCTKTNLTDVLRKDIIGEKRLATEIQRDPGKHICLHVISLSQSKIPT